MYRTAMQQTWHRSAARGWYTYGREWARLTFYTPSFDAEERASMRAKMRARHMRGAL